MATKRRKLESEAPGVISRKVTINDLPPEFLSQIFNFLPAVDLFRSRAVCKRWRDFGSEGWPGVRTLDLIAIEKLKNKSSFIPGPKRKNRFANDDEYPSLNERFAVDYPQILSLRGKFAKVLKIPVASSFDMIRIAAESCRNLTSIVIRFQTFEDKWRHCRDLETLFENSRGTLRRVVLENVGRDFSTHADCLLELPEELVELQLWGYKAHFASYLETITTPSFEFFIPAIQRLKKLQILVLNGLSIDGSQLEMIGNFHDLRYLEILWSFPANSTLPDIEVISTCCELEYLSLHKLKAMGVVWFDNLVKNNPNLKHFKLQYCKLRAKLIERLSALSKLETLSLTNLLLPKRTDFRGFTHLKKFICSDVQNHHVKVLLEAAPELNFLNLRDSKNITSEVLNTAHEVTTARTNGIPLHIVVPDNVLEKWEIPWKISPLLILESTAIFNETTRGGYDGNVEEIFY
ncbi:uncharacterized protein LOC107035721 [Diachasma alloeum]|uniref:uncharacterized protein LOC107035721 n=1 Tax=Diachasma alloeum TaxID=454923 RepID=UPI00073826F0|nr:uncharacterized protein LOC107035721 [Diachasma alloeum]